MTRRAKVVFPEPLAPLTTSTEPGAKLRLTDSNIGIAAPGKENATSRSSTAPEYSRSAEPLAGSNGACMSFWNISSDWRALAKLAPNCENLLIGCSARAAMMLAPISTPTSSSPFTTRMAPVAITATPMKPLALWVMLCTRPWREVTMRRRRWI